MRIIVFSKDRPLQLDAYLASLLHCGKLDPSDVSAVYVPDPCYEPLIADWPQVNWVAEADGFFSALKGIIDALDDDELLMFGCDDVVFFRDFDVAQIKQHMKDHPDVLGLALRLGTNVVGWPNTQPNAEKRGDLWVWDTDAQKKHWRYPFELMGTVYRSSLVKRILEVGGPFRGPNDFEGIGMRLCSGPRMPMRRKLMRALRGKPAEVGENQRIADGRLMMLDGPNHCAAQDVNLVQSIVANTIQGTDEHDIDTLKQKYADGYRIDWRSMQGIVPDDCFIGDRYWKLMKT